MPPESSILQTAVIFLLAAIIAVLIAKRFQLSAVFGYLLAGVLIGPSALQLIDNPENISHISELGIVLLLFIIGLEISPRRLWIMRKAVFGAGIAQVVLTTVVIGTIAWIAFGQTINAALVIGAGLALSSTAFGLQILAERKSLNTVHGRLAFAILLFQDIAAIPLIAMIPVLGKSITTQTTASDDFTQLIKIIASLAAVIIGGRYLLKPVFRLVVNTGLQELTTATALMVVIGTACLMELAGISMALGAFLAGVLLADSEYRHELKAQIEPFKGLLLGLFFMSVGMSANIPLLLEEPATIIRFTLLLIIVKLPLIYLVGMFFGFNDRQSGIRLALLLASGGEFAFVVFKLGLEHQIFDTRVHDILILGITLSMVVMPILVLIVVPLLKQPKPESTPPPEYTQISHNEPRVIIAGMGRMGQIIARILHAQGIPFIALDMSIETIRLTRNLGHVPIYFGNPQRPEILRTIHAEADKAEFFIVVTDDPDANLETTRMVRKMYPHLKIISRARNRQHVHHLLDLDADPVRETFHSSLEMGRKILVGLGLSETNAESRIKKFKEHDEKVLAAQHLVYDDETAIIQTALEARDELRTLFESDVETENNLQK
jgi:glutathione-regulated potassium-efflux system protein KefB